MTLDELKRSVETEEKRGRVLPFVRPPLQLCAHFPQGAVTLIGKDNKRHVIPLLDPITGQLSREFWDSDIEDVLDIQPDSHLGAVED